MLMKLRRRMQNQKGFTLVELMVVVVILGILVAIAVPVYNSVTEKAERSAVEANLRTIDGAIMMYYANTDADKGTLGTSDLKDAGKLVTEYLAAVPEGPAGVTYGITSDRATASGKAGGKTLSGATLDNLPWS